MIHAFGFGRNHFKIQFRKTQFQARNYCNVFKPNQTKTKQKNPKSQKNKQKSPHEMDS